MIKEYIQSKEQYKGFELQIRRFCLDDRRLTYHRQCIIFKNGQSIAISKTKKEAKDLIDHDCFK